jgi:hypothetical protein
MRLLQGVPHSGPDWVTQVTVATGIRLEKSQDETKIRVGTGT